MVSRGTRLNIETRNAHHTPQPGERSASAERNEKRPTDGGFIICTALLLVLELLLLLAAGAGRSTEYVKVYDDVREAAKRRRN